MAIVQISFVIERIWLLPLLFTLVSASLNPFESTSKSTVSESCKNAISKLGTGECKEIQKILRTVLSNPDQKELAKACKNLDPCVTSLAETQKYVDSECTLPTDVVKVNGLAVNRNVPSDQSVVQQINLSLASDLSSSWIWYYKHSCQEAAAALLPDAPGTVRTCSRYRHHSSSSKMMEAFGRKKYISKKDTNSCWRIIAEEGITPEELLAWNPSLDSGLARCELQPGMKYCVAKRSMAASISSSDFADIV